MSEPKVGYVFQFAANIGDGMTCTINGNFSEGASVEVMNAEIDKLKSVFDRQRAKNEIALLEARIEEGAEVYKQMLGDLQRYMEPTDVGGGVKRGPRIDPAVVQRMKDGIEKQERELEKGKLALTATRKRAE